MIYTADDTIYRRVKICLSISLLNCKYPSPLFNLFPDRRKFNFIKSSNASLGKIVHPNLYIS